MSERSNVCPSGVETGSCMTSIENVWSKKCDGTSMAKNQLARNSAASALSAPLCLADDVLTEDSGVLGPVFLYRMHLGTIPRGTHYRPLNVSVSCAGRQGGVASPTFALSSVSPIEHDGPNSTEGAKSYRLPYLLPADGVTERAGAETVSRT